MGSSVALLAGLLIAAAAPVRPGVDAAAMREALETVPGTFSSAASYAQFLRARLLHHAGDDRRAADALRIALATDEGNPYLREALAETWMRLSDFARAERILRSVLDAFPRRVATQRMLGRVFFETHRWTRAQAALQRARELDPRDAETVLLLAELALQGNRTRDAVRGVSELADLTGDPIGLRRLGIALTERGDVAAAEPLLVRATALDPADFEGWAALGQVQEMRGKTAAAEASYDRALEREPDNADVLLTVGRLELRAGEESRARGTFDRLERVTDDPETTVKVAFAWLSARRQAEAAAVLDDARHARPRDARVAFYAGMVHERAGELGEAVKAYAEVPPESQLGGEARIRRAVCLGRAGRHAEALALLEGALKSGPDDAALQTAYAGALETAGRREEAERSLRLAATKGGVEVTEALAELLDRGGKGTEAVAVLSAALARKPRDESLLFALGASHERHGDHARALLQMRQVLAVNPDSALALNFIGYTLAEQGEQFEEAERMVQRALQLKPQTGAFVDSLGWVYFRRGDFSRAVGTLEQAAALAPDEPVILSHLGDAYRGAAKKAEAVTAYRRALELLGTAQDVESREQRSALERKLKSLSSELAGR